MTQPITNQGTPQLASPPRRLTDQPPGQRETMLITPSARHSRKCTVCRHPHRYLIDLNFLRWYSPKLLARQFGINNRASIYHHAHATRLFEFRQLISYSQPPTEQRDHEMATNPALLSAARVLDHEAHAGPASTSPFARSRERLLRRAVNRAPK